MNAVLLRPLSYPHPERMVWLTTRDRAGEGFTSLDFGTWPPAATSFEHMVAYGISDSTLVASGDASRIRILSASTGFWALTGARPLLGALPEASARDVLVLSYRAYRDRFQADASVIGRGRAVGGGVVPVNVSTRPLVSSVSAGSTAGVLVHAAVSTSAHSAPVPVRVVRLDKISHAIGRLGWKAPHLGCEALCWDQHDD